MDDGNAQDITTEIEGLRFEMEKQNKLQEEANGLLRSLIPALQATAQELLELRQHLEESGE